MNLLSKYKKEIGLYLLAFITAIPFFLDLNTSYFIENNYFFMILFDDFFIGVILLSISIFSLVIHKKFIINKFEIFIFITLFIYSLYLFIGYELRDRNLLKILVYVSFFIIFLNHKNFFLGLFDFKKFIKIFFIIVFGLLTFFSILELALLYNLSIKKIYLVSYLENFITNDTSFLSNNNSVDSGTQPVEKLITEDKTKYRLSILLSNPTTLMMSLSLTYFIFDRIYKNSKFKYFILLLFLFLGFFTYSKLYLIFILILPILFFKSNYNKKILTFIFTIAFIFLLLFILLIDLNLLITNVYSSRLIFYDQFLNQFNLNYLFRYDFNNLPVFINIDNIKTGPHSDLIYLIGYYGLLFTILFLLLVIPRLNFDYLLIYLLVISLLNGIVLTTFVWIILILNNVNENIDSNSN